MTTVDVGDRITTVMGIDPTAEAISYRGEWWTWADVSHVARRLDDLLPAGEGLPVAIVMRNRPAHVASILGSIARGRCIVPVSSIQGPDRLAGDVAGLQTPVVVADVEDWQHDQLVAAVRERGALGIGLDGRRVVVVLAADPAPVSIEGTAVLMPTSGTTGPPKRVHITYRDVSIGFDRIKRYSKGNESAASAATLSKGIAISSTPLVHIAGLWEVLQFAIEGRRLAMLDRFEPHAWSELVAEHRPVVTMLPPTALVMLLDAGIEPVKLASLRAVMCGTAPLSPEVEDRFTGRFGIPVLTTYGATEFPGGLVGWSMDDKRRVGASKRGSVGRPRPGVEVRVVDPETGEPMPSGVDGAIEAKTPQTVARGVQGWVRTTDLGRLDDDGFLWVSGRADGAINRGGFKILPEVVESALAEHPAVRAVGVVGIADERLGQVPVAAVEVREDVTGEDLVAWLRDRLLTYQVPVRIAVVHELPRTASMKVSRPRLAEMLQ